MKYLFGISLFALAFALSVPALAIEEPLTQPPDASGEEIGWTEGTVKKVDVAAGKVTLSHGPLKNLGMPGMTMIFRVKEAAWLGQMKPGDRIRFVADKVNGAITVVQFEADAQ